MKPKFLIILIACIAVTSIGIYFFINLKANTTADKINPQQTDSLLKAKRYSYQFSGDDGVLIKGKLYDENYREAFEQLPDTLIHIHFGDQYFAIGGSNEVPPDLQAAGGTTNEAHQLFSYFQEQVSSSKLMEQTKRLDKTFLQLLKYLELAEDGKATFPTFTLAKGMTCGEMMTAEAFNDKYSDRFLPQELAALPCEMKQVMLSFFNSAEGQHMDFATTPQQKDNYQLYSGNFSGSNKREFAALVNSYDEQAAARKWNVLVFIRDKTDLKLVYHQLYTEEPQLTFVSKNNVADSNVYQDSEEKQPLAFDGLIVKQSGRPDVVLSYSPKYDMMQQFAQLPLSQMPGDH